MKVLSVLAFVCLISASMACKCFLTDVKHHFCTSDFALKIEVTTERQTTDNPHEVLYGSNVTFNFKADDRMKIAIISGKFYTSDSSASCGVELKKGQTYIVIGNFHDGKLHINSCGFVREVNHLTSEEKQFFENSYKTVAC